MIASERLRRIRSHWLAISGLAVAGLAGCGGGGSNTPSPPPSSGLQPSATYAARCVNPRPAGTIDPLTGNPYGDQAGSVTDEKNWVRSWIDETYLWYTEVPNLSASAYPDPVLYFNVLKTAAKTASGNDKDRFHFTYGTPEWVSLSTSGVELSYGMEVGDFVATAPRRYVIAYTEPGSPAEAAGVIRGDELVTVDGVDFVNGSDVDTLNAALFPTSSTSTHSFVFRDPLTGTNFSVTLQPGNITRTPVRNVQVLDTTTGPVGYMLFNDHLATSEAQLIAAVNTLNAAGPVNDLVLDIRYNGGGYLDIASELAYMIAGNTRTTGKAFETLSFNAKNPFNFTAADSTTPFHNTTQGFSTTSGQALPALNLGRVFVLTGDGTCSASEAIINGLRGVDVQVVQIGATTCGKPYGFFPTDNCGTTYFSIQFAGVNNKGFGDYSDGFVPGGSGTNGVTGCAVSDDFSRALGDPAEARFATALSYRSTGSCPVATSRTSPLALHASPVATMLRSPLRENRIYRSK